MRFLVLNGPNLDLLGTRRPEVYGDDTLYELNELCQVWAAELGDAVDSFQTNHEGELIERIHAARTRVDGIVLNAAAHTHTSYAIHDAIETVELPTVEVHISNVMEREPWRRVSRIRPACVHGIYGRGLEGYRWALRHLHHRLASPPDTRRYGSTDDHVGDLRVPPGDGPFPVAVMLHGGFWKHQWTRDTVDGIAADLPSRGIATWVPEYRRVGTGGGASSTTVDVARAIDHLADLADEAALDLDRLVLVGHSAGGHLALTAVGATSIRPRGVVGLAPVADLAAAARDGLGGGAVAAFAGVGPYGDLSPIERLPLGVHLSLVHGAEDDAVPVGHTDHFAAEAEASGDEVDYHRLEGVGHMALIDPASPAWTVARRSILDLLG